MIALFFSSLFSLGLAYAQDRGAAPDVIFVNGDIFPGAVFTTEPGKAALTAKIAGPRAQAIAVANGRVIAIGSNADIRKLRDRHTQEIDLGRHFVMPGFNDAHAHLASGGFERLEVDLVGTRSLEEMKQRIAAKAAELRPGEWLQGSGWDHTKWEGSQRLPSRQDLDEVSKGHPGFFNRVDGHIAVANSAALQQAGVTRNTPDPPGGKIDRDANGEPTGILRETAKALVARKIPPPSPAQRRHAAELALAEAARWGLTSAQDNSAWEDFLVYEDLERQGKLTLRIAEWLPFNAPVSTLEQHRSHHSADDPLLHTTMLKGFMDGSLGSRTAALKQPYADDLGNKGLPQYEPDKLNAMAVERAKAGFQLGFHAIGDEGVQMALDAFRLAENAVKQERGAPERGAPERGFRLRVEHAQITDARQFEEFHQLGVIASMQPNHLLTDMNWAESRIGPERASTSYAWRSFLDHGVWLAFGTDFPVEPLTPFRGLYAAVTRKNEAGTKQYFPQEKLTILEALAAYTTGSAYAQFAERDKGTLEPGKLADFVVLDRDLTKAAPEAILQTRVLRTVVGGKTVYSTQ
jgi:predicted amidohydrolase YtcJ